MTSQELLPLLRAKVVEEALEFFNQRNRDGAIEELADLMEVIHAAASLYGVDRKGLDAVADKKRRERGGFERGIVLASTEEAPLFDLLQKMSIPGVAEPPARKKRRGGRRHLSPGGPSRRGRWSIAAPLVPPDPLIVRGERVFGFFGGRLEIGIDYGEKEVNVRVTPKEGDVQGMDDTQLKLFEQ